MNIEHSHVVGQVVFLANVDIKTVWNRVEVVAGHPADEAVALHVLFDALQLITKLTERVDDQTCDMI